MEHTIQFVRPTDRKELLPCPFCGNGEVVYEQYMHDVGERWRVVCCGCMASIDPGYARNPETVRGMWNRRTLPRGDVE